MGCKGCDEKKSRHTNSPRVEKVENKINQIDGFAEAQSLTYKQLQERREQFKREQELLSDKSLTEMSDAMKRSYVDGLIDAANYEATPLAISPDVAIMTLDKILRREDFSFIHEVYPNLMDSIRPRANSLKLSILKT